MNISYKINQLSDHPNFLEGLSRINRSSVLQTLNYLSPEEIEKVGQCSKALHQVSKDQTLWKVQAKKWGVSQNEIAEIDGKSILTRKMKALTARSTFHFNGNPLPDELDQSKGQTSKKIHEISEDKSLPPNNFGDYNLPIDLIKEIFSYFKANDLLNLQKTSESFKALSKDLLQKACLECDLITLLRKKVPAYIVEHYLRVYPNAIVEHDSKTGIFSNTLYSAIKFNASPKVVELLLDGGARDHMSYLWDHSVLSWAITARPSPKIMKSLLETSPTRLGPSDLFSIEKIISLSMIHQDWEDLKYALAAHKLGLYVPEASYWLKCQEYIANGFILTSGEEFLNSWLFKQLTATDHENDDIRNYTNKVKNEVLHAAVKKGFCAEAIRAIIERGASVDDKTLNFAISNNASPEVIQVLAERRASANEKLLSVEITSTTSPEKPRKKKKTPLSMMRAIRHKLKAALLRLKQSSNSPSLPPTSTPSRLN